MDLSGDGLLKSFTLNVEVFFPQPGHDLFLPLYDPLVSLLGGDRARNYVIEQARIEPENRILDIGCGTGTFVVLLKRQFPSAEVGY